MIEQANNSNKGVWWFVGGCLTLIVIICCVVFSVVAWQISNGVNTFDGVFNSPIVEREFDLAGFSEIKMNAIGDINFTQADTYSIMVTAPQAFYDQTNFSVQSEALVINSEVDQSNFWGLLGTFGRVNIMISSPNISEISISGAGNFVADQINVNNFTLNIEGAADVEIAELLAATTTISLEGAGDININAGSTQQLDLDVEGAGDIDTQNFTAANAIVRVIGTGDARINVTDSLDATISGSGDIRYSGNPTNVTESVSGVGSIREVN